MLPIDVIFYSYNAPNSTSAGAPPHISLRELTALPQTTSWMDLRGPTSNGKAAEEGRDRRKKEEERGRDSREGRGNRTTDRTFPQFQICHYTTDSSIRMSESALTSSRPLLAVPIVTVDHHESTGCVTKPNVSPPGEQPHQR